MRKPVEYIESIVINDEEVEITEDTLLWVSTADVSPSLCISVEAEGVDISITLPPETLLYWMRKVVESWGLPK